MTEYKVFNILDMAKAIGESNLKELLSDFCCPKNEEIQQFVRTNAYDFARKKLSVTYLAINEDNYIAAIFTLAHKAVEIGDASLSNSKRKKGVVFLECEDKPQLLNFYQNEKNGFSDRSVAKYHSATLHRFCIDIDG